MLRQTETHIREVFRRMPPDEESNRREDDKRVEDVEPVRAPISQYHTWLLKDK